MKNYLNNWSTVGPEGLSSFCHCYCIVLRVICILYRRSNKPKSADFLLVELNHLKKISGKFKLRYSIHYEIEAGDAILICRIGGHIMWCHEKSHSKLKCCKTMWTISSLHTDLMFFICFHVSSLPWDRSFSGAQSIGNVHDNRWMEMQFVFTHYA